MKRLNVFQKIKIRFLIEIRAIKAFVIGVRDFSKALKEFEKSMKDK